MVLSSIKKWVSHVLDGVLNTAVVIVLNVVIRISIFDIEYRIDVTLVDQDDQIK